MELVLTKHRMPGTCAVFPISSGAPTFSRQRVSRHLRSAIVKRRRLFGLKHLARGNDAP
jgi:hypothetical protein